MNCLDVNGFLIGGEKAFIIADIGSNHRQDLILAKETIDAAVQAGANAVKFQSIQLDQLYWNPDQTTSDFIQKLEFPEDWHGILKEYCDQRNILFFSSPTYLRAVDLLEDIDIPLYKLASAQIGTFPQIVEKVAQLHKPTIFSTGISNYEEIIRAVQIFRKYENNQFAILHCNSIYPTPPERVNLSLIDTYRYMFGSPVGFSDHTIGTHVSLAAVSKGANVIEKHFTLNYDLGTPDCSSFASDPEELRKLVVQIRAIEQAKENSMDRINIQKEEADFKESIRYVLISKKNLKAEALLSDTDIEFRRYHNGIDCRKYFNSARKLITRTAIAKGEVILPEMVKFI